MLTRGRIGSVVAGLTMAALAMRPAGTLSDNRAAAEFSVPYALDLPGDGRYLDFGANADDLGIAGNRPKTIELLVFIRSFQNHEGVFSLGAPRRDRGEFTLRVRVLPGEKNRFRAQFWGRDIDVPFEYDAENAWVHFAMTHDGTAQRVYANGTLVAEQRTELDTAPEHNLKVGLRPIEPHTTLDGIVRELRVWRTALDAEAIRARMATTLRGDEEGLVGYWPMNEGAGDVVHDRSANRNHAIVADARWTRALDEQAARTASHAALFPAWAEIARTDALAATRGRALRALLDLDVPAAERLSVALDALQDVRESTDVRLAALKGIRGRGWADLVAADRRGADVLAAVVRDRDGPVGLRMAAYALHPARSELTAVLLEMLKDETAGGRERAAILETLLAAGPDSLRALAADPAVLERVRAFSLPWTVNSALRVEACRALRALGEPLPDSANDWPMWQYDAGRSGQSPVELPEPLRLQWTRQLPRPRRAWAPQLDDRGKLDFDVSYSPAVAGDKIFVPSMTTDSLTAYRIADGSEVWRFHADGPVRLAPAVWNGMVYFVSDDGRLYCVNADDGALVWTFRGGPSDHRLLGNGRIINIWAARGGPAIVDGKVYFAAGVWPLHGVFVYALDAADGRVAWVNDTTSSDYVKLPHARARGYGGLAPQGYLAVADDRLVVSGGRGMPAYLNRATGVFERANFRPHKGAGGYAVHAGGTGFLRDDALMQRVASVAGEIEGRVFDVLAARQRLFVTTEEGTLYCFGAEPVEPKRHRLDPSPLAPRADVWAESAADMLAALGENEGHALFLGAGSGDLLREILVRSELHVTVAEGNRETVRKLREELVAAGVYGERAAVIETDPAAFSVQPYLFSLIASEDVGAAGLAADADELSRALDRLRPYGGVAWLGVPDADEPAWVEAALSVRADRVAAEVGAGRLFAQRGGPLTGAGQWTHQYHDAANTLLSRDTRVRLPLGLLWYGGPSHDNVLPRHAGGPRPQIAGGRLVFLGVETIAARCVYTGRPLWERTFPGIGHPFTNLEHEEQWREGEQVYMSNIPGATYIGSPFVTLPDSVYLRYDGRLVRLDAASGQTLAEFALPGRSVAQMYGDRALPDWGHTSVQGDVLVVTAEPHLFEDQALGWLGSYSGTSSRLLVAMDRHGGGVLWTRAARVGFRHQAIVSSPDTLYAIDGLSENAVRHWARRGRTPQEPSRIYALNLRTGEEIWSVDSEVFGTYLMYNGERDILIEGGSQDLRRTLEDEPRNIVARRGDNGAVLWSANFVLPGAALGDMLVPGRPGRALSLRTGEPWPRTPVGAAADAGARTLFSRLFRRARETAMPAEARNVWTYRRAYGCNTLNASEHLLLYRSGYAAYYDLEHESGTGNLAGIRSGCTASMLAADGVLSALDYTRTCTCSYALQTSAAFVHMPDDSNIEFWTRYDAASPDPTKRKINYGAPGRRVDAAGSGGVWHDEPGTHRRHPSAIADAGGSLDWVVASGREFDGPGTIVLEGLPAGTCTLRLHFAELRQDVKPGQRVFDIFVNGRPLSRAFDILERSGGVLRGTVETFVVKPRGGVLRIELNPGVESEFGPLINGIEVKRR